MRLASPKPGKKAKSVGDAVAEKRNRFPCVTKEPPVFRFLIAKSPLVVFAMPRAGCSFHEPRKSTGRLMPVFQSIPVEKSPRKVLVTVRESPGFPEVGSSI